MIRQIPLPLPHDQAMGADDFLVTTSNQEAVAWIDAWPNWPSPGLVVTGLSGSGKTHLLNLWLAKTGGTSLTIGELITHDSLTLAGKIHAVACDDADGLAGHPVAEEKLFHLYNYLKEVKGFLLLTMARGAGQIDFLLPDLRSRLIALPAVALGAPDDVLLQALIVKQFRDRQVTLDAGVVTYLLQRTARDAASIRDLVQRLDREAMAEGRKITIALARRVLENQDV